MKPHRARLITAILSFALGSATSAQDTTEAAADEAAQSYWGDLTDGTIDLYENADSRFLQRIRLVGRAQYQAARVEGQDARGRDFTREFDEYRRLRLGLELDFNDFLSAEVDTHLVEDNRFRGTAQHTGFGYQELADAWIGVDLESALDWDWIDDLDLKVGRQKIGIGYERHQSSVDILTVERSALANYVGGENERPTGGLLSIQQGRAELSLGYFTTAASSGLASFDGDGFYYTSLDLDLPANWRLLGDWAQASNHGPGTSLLGYAWAGSLSAIYERKRGGVVFNLVHGDNGGPRHGNPRARRQGDFSGVVIMPWFWVKKEVLQLVIQAQWQRSEESEGIRIGSRYLRQLDDVPGFNVENGYGDRHHSLYLGLNYHPWAGRTKIMGGLLAENLRTVREPVEATTQFVALRTEF